MSKGGAKMILLVAAAIVILGAAGFFLAKSRGYLSTSINPSGSANLTQTSLASDNMIDSELKSLDSDSSALDASFNDKAFDATGD